ncbi:MAG: dihydroneopterin aldolase [Gammaproteobacteria bacterium]|nr:dihydroneopterin aldolase [Gammaproteobacteria bacterium]
MDIVYITDLRIETIIGVYAWERQVRQTLVIDLEMGTDIRPAATSDDIADTLDYKAVTKRVIAYTETNHFQLVETLAERLATLLREEFSIPWLRLRINKQGAVRGVRDVGVMIERGERE